MSPYIINQREVDGELAESSYDEEDAFFAAGQKLLGKLRAASNDDTVTGGDRNGEKGEFGRRTFNRDCSSTPSDLAAEPPEIQGNRAKKNCIRDGYFRNFDGEYIFDFVVVKNSYALFSLQI